MPNEHWVNLGAITHGLLQQRQAFQNIYQRANVDVKGHISKNFLAAMQRSEKHLMLFHSYVASELNLFNKEEAFTNLPMRL